VDQIDRTPEIDNPVKPIIDNPGKRIIDNPIKPIIDDREKDPSIIGNDNGSTNFSQHSNSGDIEQSNNKTDDNINISDDNQHNGNGGENIDQPNIGIEENNQTSKNGDIANSNEQKNNNPTNELATNTTSKSDHSNKNENKGDDNRNEIQKKLDDALHNAIVQRGKNLHMHDDEKDEIIYTDRVEEQNSIIEKQKSYINKIQRKVEELKKLQNDVNESKLNFLEDFMANVNIAHSNLNTIKGVEIFNEDDEDELSEADFQKAKKSAEKATEVVKNFIDMCGGENKVADMVQKVESQINMLKEEKNKLEAERAKLAEAERARKEREDILDTKERPDLDDEIKEKGVPPKNPITLKTKLDGIINKIPTKYSQLASIGENFENNLLSIEANADAWIKNGADQKKIELVKIALKCLYGEKNKDDFYKACSAAGLSIHKPLKKVDNKRHESSHNKTVLNRKNIKQNKKQVEEKN